MKRFCCIALTLCLTAGAAFAQQVKTLLGDLTISGIVWTGITAKMVDQNEAGNDDTWEVGFISPTVAQNWVELQLSYKFLNYGAYIAGRMQKFDTSNGFENSFGTIKDGDLTIPNVFIYANFFDNKFKVSMGKLYDRQFIDFDSSLWRTPIEPGITFTGEGNDMFGFGGKGIASMRFEYKPIRGLDVGAQFFFIKKNSASAFNKVEVIETLGEIGIGADYKTEMFDVTAGLRLDSSVDPLGFNDTKTYLEDYYGNVLILDPAFVNWANQVGPRYKHMDKIYTVINGRYNAKPYSDGHYVFAGFSYKGVKNLTAMAETAFFSIADFNRFGYGHFKEYFKYNDFIPDSVPGLGASLAMTQQFYGGDVFGGTRVGSEEIKNSPFFTFTPEVSYKLGPFNLSFSFMAGVCPDVLDSNWKIMPKINLPIGMGLCSVDLFYSLEHLDFVDTSEIEPKNTHVIGLNVMLLF